MLLESSVLTKKTGNNTNKDRIAIFFFFYSITKEQSKFFNVYVHVVMKTIVFKTEKEKVRLG